MPDRFASGPRIVDRFVLTEDEAEILDARLRRLSRFYSPHEGQARRTPNGLRRMPRREWLALSPEERLRHLRAVLIGEILDARGDAS